MVPFGDACDVAVLINFVSAFSVWASARFAKNDLTQFLEMFRFPPGLGSQFRQPTNVSMRENDWFYRVFYTIRGRDGKPSRRG